jgi:hypothetical protein
MTFLLIISIILLYLGISLKIGRVLSKDVEFKAFFSYALSLSWILLLAYFVLLLSLWVVLKLILTFTKNPGTYRCF